MLEVAFWLRRDLIGRLHRAFQGLGFFSGEESLEQRVQHVELANEFVLFLLKDVFLAAACQVVDNPRLVCFLLVLDL